MILTAEMTEVQARTAVDHYLATGLGPAYKAGRAQLRDDGRWSFVVLCQRADMRRVPVVGFIYLDARTGQVEDLSADRLRDIREAGAVQAAQGRRQLARDENGYVLRRQAQIKADIWLSNHVGLKVQATDGVWVVTAAPVWRFSLRYHELTALGSLDVDAQSGQIIPLTTEQIQTVQERVCAVKQYRSLAPAV